MDFLKANTKRIVIKVGTNTLTYENGTIHSERLRAIARQITQLQSLGIEIVLVSSGAVGLGMGRLQLKNRPTDLESLQACAAIGQTYLMNWWQKGFAEFRVETAQVLLTREDVRGRSRHLAIRQTLNHLLKNKIIPVVNENDTVSAAEIKFGDNDVLSAMTASLLKADLLVILSTISGLMNLKEENRLIPIVEEITPEIESLAGGSLNDRSTGGMVTKLEAAKIATQSGCGVFIGDGAKPNLLTELIEGRAEGTFFIPKRIPMVSKKRWIAFFERPLGSIEIDAGAKEALVNKGSSLLAKGVLKIKGSFPKSKVINVVDETGRVFARGVSEHDSEILKQILGMDSAEIKRKFPDIKRCEVIHRDRLVLV